MTMRPSISCCRRASRARLADQVRNAGSVFIGAYTPESAGDYASGTNNVLPTYGYARAFGGVTTESFLKSITFQELTARRWGSKAVLGPVVVRLAETREHLEARPRPTRSAIRLGNARKGSANERRLE